MKKNITKILALSVILISSSHLFATTKEEKVSEIITGIKEALKQNNVDGGATQRKNMTQQQKEDPYQLAKTAISAIQNAEKITILGSIPDGDTIYTSLAISQYLKHIGKTVEIIWNGYLAQLIKYDNEIKIYTKKNIDYEEIITPDVLISVDESNQRNLFWHPSYNQKTLINIDHHPTNELYGNINIVDSECSSASEVFYNLLEKSNAKTSEINNKIKENIALAFLSDTKDLKYVKPLSKPFMENINIDWKQLILKKNDSNEIEKTSKTDILDKNGYNASEATGSDSELIYKTLDYAEIDNFENIKLEHVSLHLWLGLYIQEQFFENNETSNELRVFIYYIPKDLMRNSHSAGFNVSLRSNDRQSAAKVAKYFRGGGHGDAAGFFVPFDRFE